jgi:hypothetical protein
LRISWLGDCHATFSRQVQTASPLEIGYFSRLLITPNMISIPESYL